MVRFVKSGDNYYIYKFNSDKLLLDEGKPKTFFKIQKQNDSFIIQFDKYVIEGNILPNNKIHIKLSEINSFLPNYYSYYVCNYEQDTKDLIESF